MKNVNIVPTGAPGSYSKSAIPLLPAQLVAGLALHRPIGVGLTALQRVTISVVDLGVTVQLEHLPYDFYSYKGLNVYVALAGSSSWAVDSLSCLCGNLDGNPDNDQPPYLSVFPDCKISANVSAFSADGLKGAPDAAFLCVRASG